MYYRINGTRYWYEIIYSCAEESRSCVHSPYPRMEISESPGGVSKSHEGILGSPGGVSKSCEAIPESHEESPKLREAIPESGRKTPELRDEQLDTCKPHPVPILLLHGFTGSSATWKNFIAAYKNKYPIIIIDLPGHGKTKTLAPRTMENCCMDMKKLLDYFQIEKVHLVGYSMGGRTALSFALLFPEYIQSLILESASPGLESADERKKRIAHDENLAKKIESEGMLSFLDFWENIPLFHTQNKLPASIQQEIRSERLSQTVDGLSQSLRFMGTGQQPSWWDKLGTFEKPVLLIVGEHDKKFIEINRRMKKFLPSCQLAIVENAGHAIHVEQTDFFGKLISRFLQSIN